MIFGKQVNKYYLRYCYAYLAGIITLFFVDWLQLKVPVFYKMVVNGLNGDPVYVKGQEVPFDMNTLLQHICLPMLGVIAALLVGRFLWRVCFFDTAINVETDLRSRMFRHAKELSQQFYGENKVGDLMSLFTNDIDTINESFGDAVLMFADAALLGSLALYKMIRMNLVMTLFCLLPLLLLFLVSTQVGKIITKRWDIRQEQFSRLSDFSQESFSGIAVIKAFVCETKELMEFRNMNRYNEKVNVDYTRVAVLLRVTVSLFEESIIGVILGYGGYLVYKGTFNTGDLIEFIGYFSSIIWPIMAVSELIDMSSRGKASLNRVTKFLETKPVVVDGPDVEPVEKLEGTIEFRNLSFTYPGATTESLSNASFRINAGENVGIIGKTGSGKTTICDLILRTYQVPDGTVFLDGRDVNTIPIRTVRDYAAYVPQDNFLFSDTIAGNIAFASDTDSREEVEAAAKVAGVYEDIEEFHHGFDTVLGERGVTVSGGQKQRISIARAIMKNAAILIMDDSVSAVDTGTERRILGALREIRKGKTTILIAHRVSSIENMDKIIYVSDGTIATVGTHKELLETCPEYQRTVELQKLEDEKAGDLNA